MMKSPTSLIRFRNAVSVVLALSAIFAVVLSAVTITQDRALGQATEDVTVFIVADSTTVEEGTVTTVTFTVSVPSGSAPDADLPIPLTVTGVTATQVTDFTLPNAAADGTGGDTSVTISASATSGTYVIDIVDTPDNDDGTDLDEPQESFTVSLGVLPSGYAAGEPSSITININDGDDNASPSGSITITIPDGDDADEDPDTPTNGLVGQELTAVTSEIDDQDHDDPATEDVDEGEMVGEGYPQGFSYRWTRIVGITCSTDNITNGEEVGTGKTYTPDNDDVGAGLCLEVTWSDKYGNGNAKPQPFNTVSLSAVTVYNLAKPYIIKADTNGNGRRDPGDVLTRDISGMFDSSNNLIDDDGNEIMTDDDPPGTIADSEVMLTWYRDGEPIMCGTPAVVCEGLANTSSAETYELVDADVAKKITLVASYQSKAATDADSAADPPVEAAPAVIDTIYSNEIGRVHSTNAATGMPVISGTAQVGATLRVVGTGIDDEDGGVVDIVFTWFYGDDVDYSAPLGTGVSYELKPTDAGKTIKVRATFNDGLGDPGMRTSAATTAIVGSPGEVSRIEPGIRRVTVSAGDTVTLSVDIYGQQNVKDNTIVATFDWTQKSGSNTPEGLDDSGRKIAFTAPSSPGTYTVTASLDSGQCQPDDEADRDADCEASITVQVRRPSPPVPDEVEPQNPPGDIPGLIPDSDGNQYEVFTPVEGGTFDGGEGYSISVPSGAVPNGEYIGIRMSDDGAASNLGQTHQRYTLMGNMYGVHAVDASGAAISSYVLEDPAEVCVPLPASARANLSTLSLAAINSDGSLTILAAQAKLNTAGDTMVCGNLSNLPATVAVGAQGAPDAIPTATPVPEPELPPTGGTSPASGSLVWVLLLGTAAVASGTFIVVGRRRKMVGSK